MLFRWTVSIQNFKKTKYSLQARSSFLIPPKNKEESGGKVSSGISYRGSLTVESALVLPLFFLCLCTMICFMDIYRLQTIKLTELCENAKETAMYAYVLDAEEEITLPAVYRYHPPVGVVPLPALVMSNYVRVHPWTGYGNQGEDVSSEEMVYVTVSGGVYHTSAGCTYLRLSIQQTPGGGIENLRNDNGARYHPCEKCSRGQQPGAVVYITGEGTRYHNEAGCSGLKRTVRLVKKSEYANLPPCSRCGAGH